MTRLNFRYNILKMQPVVLPIFEYMVKFREGEIKRTLFYLSFGAHLRASRSRSIFCQKTKGNLLNAHVNRHASQYDVAFLMHDVAILMPCVISKS